MGTPTRLTSPMRQPRWLAPWKDSPDKPAIYHCISRVVDRRMVLDDLHREKFRTFLRMQENFSGCRILAYCVMSNHFHLLLEVPPMPAEGLADAELLKRLDAIYPEATVALFARQLATARQRGDSAAAQRLHDRHTYRMHDLSEFMKTLLQRFTRWFNRSHQRSGTLWESRFKSVLVEDGTAARTMAAYIDLNPVRAGMVTDPAHYRWSSYGEAVGGGPRGNGAKARAGLARACLGNGASSSRWAEFERFYRDLMGVALRHHAGKATAVLAPEVPLAAMLRCRVRYFTDGAVIGSRGFVDEVFAASRHRFPERRRDGPRRLRGQAKAAAGTLWSMRDLRVGI